jgi:NitT/TauT family transport system substrate-binding protein
MHEVLLNPDAAIDVLAKSQPLINKERRLLYVTKTLIDTPESRDIGVGDTTSA